MPLPKRFKTRDEIPEAFRDAYVEKDGEWVLDESETTGLKDSQRRLLDEKKKTEDSLKAILGNRSADEVKELLGNLDKAEEERQRKAGELDNLIAKRVKQREEELLPQVEAGQKAIAELAKRNFRDKVNEVASEVGINQKHSRAFLKTVEDDMLKLDGEELVVLAPGGGKRNISPKEFLEKEFKKDYPEFFLASGGSGSGSTNQNRGTGSSGTGGVVDITDPSSFLANVDNVASGKMGTFAPPSR